MEIVVERIGSLGGITVQENLGEKFYSLENILASLGKDTKPCGTEQEPTRIDGQIIFGYVMRGGDIVHSVFVDQGCMEKLVGETTRLQ